MPNSNMTHAESTESRMYRCIAVDNGWAMFRGGRLEACLAELIPLFFDKQLKQALLNSGYSRSSVHVSSL